MVEKEKLFRIINETAALTKVDILDFGIFVEVFYWFKEEIYITINFISHACAQHCFVK